MELGRWHALMNDEQLRLTPEEREEGWHFCWDWDGLLKVVGELGCLCTTDRVRSE